MYKRNRKEKIDLALKFVEFTKKQERSQIKPRNHEEAKIQGFRNALETGTRWEWWILLWRKHTIVLFQDGTDLEPNHNLYSRFLALRTCTGHPRTHRTANDSIRKRLLRRRKKLFEAGSVGTLIRELIDVKVFRYSFLETIPIFFYRLKRDFIRVRSL